MPRSVKSTILEVLVIVVTMSAVGHLSVSFWERFVVKNELTQMKQSLHYLKTTLANLGNAYDTLHTEILGLEEVTKKKNSLYDTFFAAADVVTREDTIEQFKTLDRRKFNDINVDINEKNEAENFPSKTNNGPLDAMPNVKAKNEATDFMLNAYTKNEAVNFPGKINANNEAVNFPLKTSTKNKALNFPLKTNANNEASNFPPKIDIKNEALNFPPKANAEIEAHNSPVKANKTTAKGLSNTKCAAITPSQHVKVVKDKTIMTRYPLKSTGAGNIPNQQLNGLQANPDYHTCLNEYICCKGNFQNSKV